MPSTFIPFVESGTISNRDTRQQSTCQAHDRHSHRQSNVPVRIRLLYDLGTSFFGSMKGFLTAIASAPPEDVSMVNYVPRLACSMETMA